MVSSKIHSDIHYDEQRRVHSEDEGHDAGVYSIEHFDRTFLITLGKPKYEFDAKYHVTYVPIYLVNLNNTIDAQIGVYEFPTNDATSMLDDEGDFDLEALPPPLWFAFAEKVIATSNSDLVSYLSKWETTSIPSLGETVVDMVPDMVSERSSQQLTTESTNGAHSSFVPAADDEEEDEDIMKLPKRGKDDNTEPDSSPSDLRSSDLRSCPVTPPDIKKGAAVALAPLPEETAEDAEAIRASFKPSSKYVWIQTYMHNPNYGIVDVEDNGDCFFAVLREAYRQRGYKTTVTELRARLAHELTEALFLDNRNFYLSLDGRIKDIDQQRARIKQSVEVDLKQRYKNTKLAAQKDLIRREVESLTKTNQELLDEREQTEQLIDETTGNLADIDTFTKYRDYVKSSRYWADTWAISTLERILRIKVIIFSEQSYDEGAMHSVLNCGEASAGLGESFQPEFYVMTSYSGNHYRTVTYRDRKMLTFDEIPYHVKIMIVNKCYEKDAGIYYLIPAFREFKARLGIDPDVGAPTTTHEGPGSDPDIDEALAHDWYDPRIVFRFHSKSESSATPGKGRGETMPLDHMDRYMKLKTHKDWRRMLDDTYSDSDTTFKINNKTYASVVHYYQSAKYHFGFPDFAQLFALESDSDISKDVALAQAAGGKTGKIKKDGKEIVLRPKTVVMDPDFYPVRCHQERIRALTAKFEQHPKLRQILLDTQRAKLTHYIAKHPSETDVELMQVRATLMANT
jgi:predicted NAD-dependent protein-ADP-ribosyltransferase YbiA (DUF1768 family)